MDFVLFKEPVAKQFQRIAKAGLLKANIDKDTIWNLYLDSFPTGTNELFRQRREYECNCCKQFIRSVGGAVAIIDGKIETVWDITAGSEIFQIVADKLRDYVKSVGIQNVFLTSEKTAGKDRTIDSVLGSSITWKHFFVNIDPKYVERDPGSTLSTKLGDHDVFLRGLKEIKIDAIDTVLELIGQDSIYRGAEFKPLLQLFRKELVAASKLKNDTELDQYVWSTVRAGNNGAIYRFKNTSMGTLVSDLSEGFDISDAVSSFEAKVAPSNYKRTSALVTPKMIEDAKKKVVELGYASALGRRYANLADIKVNDILFADRSISALQKTGDVFDDLIGKSKAPLKFDKVEEISIDRFIADVLPTAKKLEVEFNNKHRNNLVSLVAPSDPTAKNMFKWDNQFSWSYAGDFTDSVKERVKSQGGNVSGDVSCRLAWDNTTDLDFHMLEPDGNEIYYGRRGIKTRCGGMLDIDANGLSGMRDDPAENIFYQRLADMRDGKYELYVNPFYVRSRANEGYTVQIEVLGDVYEYQSDTFPARKTKVATITKKGDKVTVDGLVKSQNRTVKVWGIDTNTFVPCTVVMNSPNYWTDANDVNGNKHYFFMLDKCVNEENARGFYNEYLKNELTPYRKVLELVGGKMRTEETDNQLSGLGFSSTNRNELIVRVTGNTVRVLKIIF